MSIATSGHFTNNLLTRETDGDDSSEPSAAPRLSRSERVDDGLGIVDQRLALDSRQHASVDEPLNLVLECLQLVHGLVSAARPDQPNRRCMESEMISRSAWSEPPIARVERREAFSRLPAFAFGPTQLLGPLHHAAHPLGLRGEDGPSQRGDGVVASALVVLLGGNGAVLELPYEPIL